MWIVPALAATACIVACAYKQERETAPVAIGASATAKPQCEVYVPIESLRRRTGGDVILLHRFEVAVEDELLWFLFYVDTDGTISDFELMDDSQDGAFVSAAVAELRKWTFEPHEIDGRRVRVCSTGSMLAPAKGDKQ